AHRSPVSVIPHTAFFDDGACRLLDEQAVGAHLQRIGFPSFRSTVAFARAPPLMLDGYPSTFAMPHRIDFAANAECFALQLEGSPLHRVIGNLLVQRPPCKDAIVGHA